MRQAGIIGFRCFIVFLVVPFVMASFSVETVFAQNVNPMDVFVDGVESFDAGDYKAAMESFDQAIALDPGNDEFVYYKALVYSKTGQKDQAVAIWEGLVQKDPANYRKAYFDIAAVYSGQSQHEKALGVLEQAIQSDPDDARAYLEAGVCQKAMGQNAPAIDSLKKASSLDPRQAPTANLVMAAIYLDNEEFDKAEELFRHVAQVDQGTPMAAAAEKSLEAVSRTRRARKSWWAAGQFTVGFDDNVLNEPLDAVAATAAYDKDDPYQTLFAEAGYRVVNQKDLRLGGSMGFTALGYHDITASNQMSFNPRAFLEYRKDRYFLRLTYDFNYYYTGSDEHDCQDWGWHLTFDPERSALKTHKIMPMLTISEPHGLSSVVSASWTKKNYFDATPNANGWQGGITQNWAVPGTPVVARLGYDCYWEDSSDSAYSYYSHTGLGGASCALPYDIIMDAQYSFARVHHDESPTVAGTNIRYWSGERKDSLHSVNLSVAKQFGEIFRVTAAYYYGFNDSNVKRTDIIMLKNGKRDFKIWDPYKYRRNAYTLTVSALF